jgi:ring-1,2-phenylacetyl-CoA epoxidase subunit PaaD
MVNRFCHPERSVLSSSKDAKSRDRRNECAEVWSWLDEVSDPEIPVISITDLGIVRDVRYDGDGTLLVALTPTYSGCPATEVIRGRVASTLKENSVSDFRIETRLSPAWTTDWITQRGRERLRAFGIAPPHSHRSLERGPIIVRGPSSFDCAPTARAQDDGWGARAQGDSGRAGGQDSAFTCHPELVEGRVACPQCGSSDTEETSHFGSTPCKALYRCRACSEPFDYFKPF